MSPHSNCKQHDMIHNGENKLIPNSGEFMILGWLISLQLKEVFFKWLDKDKIKT